MASVNSGENFSMEQHLFKGGIPGYKCSSRDLKTKIFGGGEEVNDSHWNK